MPTKVKQGDLELLQHPASKELLESKIPARFASRRREFEDAWYGRAIPPEESVRGWLAEFEPPAAP